MGEKEAPLESSRPSPRGVEAELKKRGGMGDS